MRGHHLPLELFHFAQARKKSSEENINRYFQVWDKPIRSRRGAQNLLRIAQIFTETKLKNLER